MKRYLFIVLAFVGCSIPQQENSAVAPPSPSIPAEIPAKVAEPIKLAWDTATEGGKIRVKENWSGHLLGVVEKNYDSLSQAKDIELFCPNWGKMARDEKEEALAEIFVAMAYYESSWIPTKRYKESTMGTDCVTKSQIYSEGLLQLSYCDKTWMKSCQFNWEKDKSLAATDAKKTIFDPKINLSCGVDIMANQIRKRGSITLPPGKGAYWAVLISGGKYQKIDEIKKRVQDASRNCRK